MIMGGRDAEVTAKSCVPMDCISASCTWVFSVEAIVSSSPLLSATARIDPTFTRGEAARGERVVRQIYTFVNTIYT